MAKKWDFLYTNATLTTCERGYGLILSGAIAIQHNKIAWLGPMTALPQNLTDMADNVEDLQNKCVTPGLIDCHTHVIYGGNRADEFEERLKGVSYQTIIEQGGGIHATVSATRAASLENLITQSFGRINALWKSGITTLEIKSGYGLDFDNEIKILTTAQKLTEQFPLTIKKTFLGAHTIPKEYKHDADQYVNLICEKIIPYLAQNNLADFVDVFCEKIAFNYQQTEKIFAAAQKNHLGIKCHADQLSNLGGTILAAEYGALSVDHLEYSTCADVKALAKSGTVAVLLPGAFYFLREKQLPPINLLREYQIPIALATDCNPGTSPILSLLLILNMAATLFGLTPEEALLGVTINAARALGMHDTHGSLSVGKIADLAIWEVPHPRDLVYYLGGNPLNKLIKEGKVVYKADYQSS